MRGFGKGIRKGKQRSSRIMALSPQHTDYSGLAQRKMCFEIHSKDEAEKSDQR